MTKRLVICEKPSVANAVARALAVRSRSDDVWESDRWIIASARGSLLESAEPEDYDPQLATWRVEDLPIIPERFRWRPPKEKTTQHRLNRLHQLIGRDDVVEIVNACDAAREGELIFKTILQNAPTGSGKPVQRAWFASVTIGAIKRAFDELRPDSEMAGLEAAAFARQRADWLVGINGSRAVSLQARRPKGRPLSVGRVQTPTLAILVEREREIDAYVPIPWWRLEVTLATGDNRIQLHTDLVPERETADQAREVVRATDQVSVRRFEDRLQERLPPLPFDLTELQTVASQRYKYSAKRTLDIAQELYLAGYLSYPRTDSRYLTGDLLGRLKSVFASVASAVPALADACAEAQTKAEQRTLPTRCVNNGRVRDHHAIIPTEKTQKGLRSLSKGSMSWSHTGRSPPLQSRLKCDACCWRSMSAVSLRERRRVVSSLRAGRSSSPVVLTMRALMQPCRSATLAVRPCRRARLLSDISRDQRRIPMRRCCQRCEWLDDRRTKRLMSGKASARQRREQR
ncbi:MAG: hypothetical protein K9L32_02320 [Chromatiaceae bacterium]|nr:hypothetical protein [Chromatiaceae bacterium]